MALFGKLTTSILFGRKTKILESGLFHTEWYNQNYSFDIAPEQNPLDHYLAVGEKKGFKPNPYFDPVFYRKKAKVTDKYGRSLLEHYLQRGHKSGLSPSKLFCAEIYLKEYPESGKKPVPALSYHYTTGQRKGNITFHQRLLKKQQASGQSTSDLISEMKLIGPSGLFDEDWYISQNQDLRNQYGMGLLHFVTHGAREGRRPNPIFDTSWYREEYLDNDKEENPLVNYIREGVQKKRNPSANFISADYQDSEFNKLTSGNKDPLAHFLLHNYKQGKFWPKPAKEDENKKSKGAISNLPVPESLRVLTSFKKQDLAPNKSKFFKNALNLHWVIPDFAAGGGGHMTIFRVVSFFEQFGHSQTIWINNPGKKRSDKNGYDDIQKYFQFFSGEVKLLDKRFDSAEGDAIIATDCWTVWPTLSASNFQRRFYFVQDFEPSFHPVGSLSLAAEETYKQDLDCLCASPWLARLMEEKYNRWARPFWLAADTKLYHPPKKRAHNEIPRIAFYARHFTARRAVELGMLALEVLAERGLQFKVHFFGADLGNIAPPFSHQDHGVASPDELARIFQKADVGVVFSATNYSLVPQEMMACGLPIVELDGDSTRCIFPEDTVTLSAPMPTSIADALQELLTSPERREKQRNAALNWVQGFSWQQSAKTVEAALIERLGEFAGTEVNNCAAPTQIKASVVIPTYNAGDQFEDVLKATVEQSAPWPFEVLVIDSGSSDKTLEIVEKFPSVKLHTIKSKDFNHGGTRNLGVELTTGEFIAFLTHDALPADDKWLYKLVTSLERCPGAAGAFGKHLAYPDASPFTKRDLDQHFENFNDHPLVLSKHTNSARFESGNQGWRQLLHFYSDNNSCMRRSVWEKLPYREVKFGEDQVWADDIIQAGYSKVYSPQARVFHSHDFSPEETFERSSTESAFFKHFFGYALIKDEADLKTGLTSLNAHDSKWAKENNIPANVLEARLKDNEARLKGYLAGALADTKTMF